MTVWHSVAPLRADLAGGTLDIWPLSQLHEGASTVNVALRLSARAQLRPGGERWNLHAGDHGARTRFAAASTRTPRRRAGDPFALVREVIRHAGLRQGGELITRVEGPPGGGIGGSSALLVALYGLAMRLQGRRLERSRIPDVARDLEARVLGLPTGVQDYYPATFGGALWLRYEPGGTRVERLDVDLDDLASRLVLAYSGKPHASAPSNWGIYRRRLEGDPAAVKAFGEIGRAAERAARALQHGDLAGLGKAMDADWAARKQLEPALAPPDLRRLEAAGRAAGVMAAKCCGAASGGCMLFLLRRRGDRPSVEEALGRAGARILPAALSRTGLRIRRAGD